MSDFLMHLTAWEVFMLVMLAALPLLPYTRKRAPKSEGTRGMALPGEGQRWHLTK